MRDKRIHGKLGRDDLDVYKNMVDEDFLESEELVHLLITGEWRQGDPTLRDKDGGQDEDKGDDDTADSSNSGSGSRGRGRRVLRLGALLAEARVQPGSGRTVISPHYESSLLYGDSHESEEYGATQFSIPNVTFPLDAASMHLLRPPDEELSSCGGGGGRGFGTSALPPDAGEIFAKVVGELLRNALLVIPENNPEIVLQIPRYMGYLRHWDPEILSIVSERAQNIRSWDAARPYTLVEFLWAYAVLGEQLPSTLLCSIVDHLLALPTSQPPPFEYSRLAWSLAAMNALDCDTFAAIGHRFSATLDTLPAQTDYSDRRESNTPSRTFLTQMFQAALHLEATTGTSHQALLPAVVRESASAAWRARASSLTTSASQRHIAAVLGMLGLKCELEYAPPGTYVIIDIAVMVPPGPG